jgi:hypothetical protein
MNVETLEKIRAELAERLVGQKFGKIFRSPDCSLRLIFVCTIQITFSSASNRTRRAFI